MWHYLPIILMVICIHDSTIIPYVTKPFCFLLSSFLNIFISFQNETLGGEGRKPAEQMLCYFRGPSGMTGLGK